MLGPEPQEAFTILVVTDIHEATDLLASLVEHIHTRKVYPDVIFVCGDFLCGDFLHFNEAGVIRECLTKATQMLLILCNLCPNIYYVHGNHDPICSFSRIDSKDFIRFSMERNYVQSIDFTLNIHGKCVRLAEDLVLCGLGGTSSSQDLSPSSSGGGEDATPGTAPGAAPDADAGAPPVDSRRFWWGYPFGPLAPGIPSIREAVSFDDKYNHIERAEVMQFLRSMLTYASDSSCEYPIFLRVIQRANAVIASSVVRSYARALAGGRIRASSQFFAAPHPSHPKWMDGCTPYTLVTRRASESAGIHYNLPDLRLRSPYHDTIMGILLRYAVSTTLCSSLDLRILSKCHKGLGVGMKVEDNPEPQSGDEYVPAADLFGDDVPLSDTELAKMRDISNILTSQMQLQYTVTDRKSGSKLNLQPLMEEHYDLANEFDPPFLLRAEQPSEAFLAEGLHNLSSHIQLSPWVTRCFPADLSSIEAARTSDQPSVAASLFAAPRTLLEFDVARDAVILLTHQGPCGIPTSFYHATLKATPGAQAAAEAAPRETIFETGSFGLREVHEVGMHTLVHCHGHTHEPVVNVYEVGRTTFFNPGAFKDRNYGLLKIRRSQGKWRVVSAEVYRF